MERADADTGAVAVAVGTNAAVARAVDSSADELDQLESTAATVAVGSGPSGAAKPAESVGAGFGWLVRR